MKQRRKWIILISVMILVVAFVGCTENEQSASTSTQGSIQDHTNPTTQQATQPQTKPQTQPTTVPQSQPTTVPHPLECEFVDVGVAEEATCVTWKKILQKCAYCEEERIYTIEYSNIPHDFSREIVKIEPACGVDGEKWMVCTICNQQMHFCEMIPRTDEHELELVEKRSASDTFVGVNQYRCKKCDAEVERYYGKTGEYDLDGITAEMIAYVRQLGFNIEIVTSTAGANTTNKLFYHGYTKCERMDGSDYLREQVLAAVKRWCDRRLAECQENGIDTKLYTCKFMLTYTNNGNTGGSSFVVYVSG